MFDELFPVSICFITYVYMYYLHAPLFYKDNIQQITTISVILIQQEYQNICNVEENWPAT